MRASSPLVVLGLAATGALARPQADAFDDAARTARLFDYSGEHRLVLVSDSEISEWDVERSALLNATTPPGHVIRLLARTSQRHWIVITVGAGGTMISSYDIERSSWSAPQPMEEFDGARDRLLLSPDDGATVWLARDHELARVDVASGTIRARWPWPHELDLGCISEGGFAWDGRRLTLTFTPHTVLASEFPRKRCSIDVLSGAVDDAGEFPAHEVGVRPLWTSPDCGRCIGFRRRARAWVEVSGARGDLARSICKLPAEFPELAMSPDGRRIAIASGGRELYQPHSMVPVGSLGKDLEIRDLASGAVLRSRRAVQEIDVAAPPSRCELAKAIVWIGDDRLLTVDRHDGAFSLCARASNDLIVAKSIHLDDFGLPVFLASNPSGTRAAVCWRGSRVLVFDTAKLELVRTLTFASDEGAAGEELALSPDGERIAMIGDDRRVWVSHAGEDEIRPLVELPVDVLEPDALRWTAGALLLAGTPSHPRRLTTLQRWRLEDGHVQWEPDLQFAVTDTDSMVFDAWNSAATRVASYRSGPEGGELVCWRGTDGTVLWQRECSSPAVEQFAWNGADELAVRFASDDALIRLSIRTGLPLNSRSGR